MASRKVRLKRFRNIGVVLLCGFSTVACVTPGLGWKQRFMWSEETLLHDGRKIVVERSDTYNANLPREIGQAAPLEEHTTTFTIPGTSQAVTWRSMFNSSESDTLNLIALDFLDGVPYAAATMLGCPAYNRYQRPNPPYVFFKYVNGWQRIPMHEFPARFQINVVVTGRKIDNQRLADAERKFGYVPAEVVARTNSDSGKSREYYKLYRVPIDLYGKCPQYPES